MEPWAAWYVGMVLCLAFLALIALAAVAENTRIGRHISDRLLAWLDRR